MPTHRTNIRIIEYSGPALELCVSVLTYGGDARLCLLLVHRVGYRLNFIDSDSAYRFRLFSIPSFDSNVIK